MEVNIDELICLIADGNEHALEDLYNIVRLDVYKFALSYMKNQSDAEDIMQDTFININRYAHLYNSKNKAMSWILTITKNLCLNKLKSNKKKSTHDISDYENDISVEDKGYNTVLVNTILNEFNEEERKIFMLSTVDNFKFREIAQILELNLSTVLSKYNRAIKRIKEKYKEGNMA